MVVLKINKLIVYWACGVCVVIFSCIFSVDLTFRAVFSFGSILLFSIASYYFINGDA